MVQFEGHCPPLQLGNDITIFDPLSDALRFIESDGSYHAYDLAEVAHDDNVTLNDVRVANRLMARMSEKTVADIAGRAGAVSGGLSHIPGEASLTDPEAVIPWGALGEVFRALESVPAVGLARATKVLHKKRPCLIPILDSVVEQYLSSVYESVSGSLAERALSLIRSYRTELNKGRDALECVRSALMDRGIELTECRLLDLYIWAYSGTYQPVWQRGTQDVRTSTRARTLPKAKRPSITSPTAGDPRPVVDRIDLFLGDDAGYLAWLVTHPLGYVLNCARNPRSDYLMVHRSQCRTIQGEPARGLHWTDVFVKVCADDVRQLASWARRETGGSLQACGLCSPALRT